MATASSGARAYGPHAACGYSSAFQQSVGLSGDPHVSDESAASCPVRLRTRLPASRAHARSYGSPAVTRRGLCDTIAPNSVSPSIVVSRTAVRAGRVAATFEPRDVRWGKTAPQPGRSASAMSTRTAIGKPAKDEQSAHRRPANPNRRRRRQSSGEGAVFPRGEREQDTTRSHPFRATRLSPHTDGLPSATLGQEPRRRSRLLASRPPAARRALPRASGWPASAPTTQARARERPGGR